MNFEAAVAAHEAWKMRLRSAMRNGNGLDADVIGRDDCCELGRWLRHAAPHRLRASVAFAECMQVHAGFHLEAARIAVAVNEGRHADADAMLAPGSSYAHASDAVVAALARLQREQFASDEPLPGGAMPADRSEQP